MKTTVDFTQNVYRLDYENMYIETRTLESVVRESAEETTSPRGVEPKLHIEEADGEWQLRCWGIGGSDSIICTYNTEAEAEQDWLNRTYKFDYLPSEWAGKWFDSIDEAIDDYLDFMAGEDEEITKEEVLAKIEATKADIEDTKKIISNDLAVDMQNAYNAFKANGQVTKKALKVARDVKYGDHHYNGCWEIRIKHADIVSPETIAQANEIIETSRK